MQARGIFLYPLVQASPQPPTTTQTTPQDAHRSHSNALITSPSPAGTDWEGDAPEEVTRSSQRKVDPQLKKHWENIGSILDDLTPRSNALGRSSVQPSCVIDFQYLDQVPSPARPSASPGRSVARNNPTLRTPAVTPLPPRRQPPKDRKGDHLNLSDGLLERAYFFRFPKTDQDELRLVLHAHTFVKWCHPPSPAPTPSLVTR